MTKNFVNMLEEESNYTLTENGARTHASSLDAVLDLFAIGGAARNLGDDRRVNLIKAAYKANPDLALRTIFYLGDIRQGAGERDLFKAAIKTVAMIDPKAMKALVTLIPEYTRWDYVYELVGTAAEEEVKNLIRSEHARVGEGTSLMYKWLKSSNTSSKESRRLGAWTAQVLGFDSKEYKGLHAYQKLLSAKRALLSEAVVEKLMTSQMWDKIDYEKVPSKASLKYREAFKKHDFGYQNYIQKVLSGEKKMNMNVTFPHDIVSKYGYRGHNEVPELEAAWKSLPNYVNSDENVIVVADTSGSMGSFISPKANVRSIDVAHAMSIYCAERLSGPFKNKVISFSSRARFFDIEKYGESLRDKVNVLWENSIVENTNLQSVFDLILSTATKNGVSQEEMPTKVLIISDMEFDEAQSGKTNLEAVKTKYANSGYKMPELVFWNVCARNVQFPATKSEKGVALVSGYSPTLFAQVLSGVIQTPLDNMLKVITSTRYDAITERLKDQK